MGNHRPNGTIRSKVGVETKECFRCKQEKDVICFQTYWYQPTKGGEKVGDPVRKRMASCKECSKKRK